MVSRRILLAQMGWFVAGCALSQSNAPTELRQLTIGTVAYGEGSRSLEQYQRFLDYLEEQTKAIIQLEPAYNELQAIGQIERQRWGLVFAPPGLAALAVSRARYLPLFQLQGLDNLSSVLIVRSDSLLQALTDINGQVLALGQPGSATGYYVPLYELYGTAPAEVLSLPTPREILTALATGQAAVGAMAKDEFERYRSDFDANSFRILHSSRRIPSGSVLISPSVDRNQQEVLLAVMNNALPSIAQEAGYVPNAAPPRYDDLIVFIDKVKPIETHIQEKPARLYADDADQPL